MISVFHGSYTAIPHPDLTFSRLNVDFGKGFYVTPLYPQAVQWALRWQHRGKTATVSRYAFHDELLAELKLKVKIFPVYDREWLRFVADNREGNTTEQYDLVQGGIANDKVFSTLELYFNKLITEEEALARLKYEKPNFQICFCRQEWADRLLSFESAEEVQDGSR